MSDENTPHRIDYEEAIADLAETLGCEPHITAVKAAASTLAREHARLKAALA